MSHLFQALRALPLLLRSKKAAPGDLVSPPVEEGAAPAKKRSFNIELTAKKVKPVEVMNLSRQLAAFLQAGLSILTAIQTLAAESPNPALRSVLADVSLGLSSGDSMADCIDRHPAVFPSYYRGALRSAEHTGSLDTVLDELSSYMERDLESRKKVRSALTYPGIIAVLAVVVVVVISAFVLPRFKTFFTSMHARLPLPTRMLLAVTNFLSTWWLLIVGLILLSSLAAFLFVRTPQGRLAKDRLLLATPVLKDVVQFSLVERFCRILSSMLAAGVVLPQAIAVSTQSLENRVYVQGLASINDSLLAGEGLSRPLTESGLFPPTASQMIRVGEESGSLDAQLDVTARYYARELDYKVKRFTALLEPAVIVVMGLVVGFVAVALISAMYGVFSQVK